MAFINNPTIKSPKNLTFIELGGQIAEWSKLSLRSINLVQEVLGLNLKLLILLQSIKFSKISSRKSPKRSLHPGSVNFSFN